MEVLLVTLDNNGILFRMMCFPAVSDSLAKA